MDTPAQQQQQKQATKCKLDIKEDELVSIALPRFNPRLVIPPTTETLKDSSLCRGGMKILIVGAPGSGKSHFIRWLLLAKAAVIPSVVVMSNTERDTGFYNSFLPPSYIFNEYSNDALKGVIARQKSVCHETGRSPWLTLVVDDCATNIKTLKGDSLKIQSELLKNARHWKMNYIVGVQDLFDVRLDMRTLFDIVILFGITNDTRLKQATEQYGGSFRNKAMFNDVFTAVTNQKHRCIVIKNNTQDLSEALSWGMAPKVLPNVKIGCIEYRCFNKVMLDEKKNLKELGMPMEERTEALFSEDDGLEY